MEKRLNVYFLCSIEVLVRALENNKSKTGLTPFKRTAKQLLDILTIVKTLGEALLAAKELWREDIEVSYNIGYKSHARGTLVERSIFKHLRKTKYTNLKTPAF